MRKPGAAQQRAQWLPSEWRPGCPVREVPRGPRQQEAPQSHVSSTLPIPSWVTEVLAERKQVGCLLSVPPRPADLALLPSPPFSGPLEADCDGFYPLDFSLLWPRGGAGRSWRVGGQWSGAISRGWAVCACECCCGCSYSSSPLVLITAPQVLTAPRWGWLCCTHLLCSFPLASISLYNLRSHHPRGEQHLFPLGTPTWTFSLPPASC